MPPTFLLELINTDGGHMREGAAFDLGFTAADIRAACDLGLIYRIGSQMGATTVVYLYAK